jgi:hypothetical protein
VGAASVDGAAAAEVVGAAGAGGGLAGAQLAIAASRAAVASAAPLNTVRRNAEVCAVDVPVGTGRSLMAHPDTPC